MKPSTLSCGAIDLWFVSRLRWTLSLLALFSVAAFSGAASAQAKRREPKVIQLEEIKIEGRVQKPNAFYILNRSNIGYEVMDLRTSFLHEVVMAVQQEPF